MRLSSKLLSGLAFFLAFGIGLQFANATKPTPTPTNRIDSRIDSRNTNTNFNTNANKNENSNRANAIQGQLQGQGQSQGQAQSNMMSNTNAGNASATVTGSGNSAVYESPDIRELPVPSTINVGSEGGPAMFSQPDKENYGPHFMSMDDLVGVLNAVDLSVADIADEGDVEMVAQTIAKLSDEEMQTFRSRKEKTPARFILKKTRGAGDKIRPLAIVTLKADDNDTMNSATLAIKLAKYADSIGGTDITLIREGVSKRLKSWGVGIGLSYNMASVGSDHNDIGSAGAGGTGWSMGQGEFVSLPYMTAIVGR